MSQAWAESTWQVSTDSHGSLKAVLELVNRVGVNAFTREDESELTPFCSLAGITLHNSRTLQVARRTQTAARLERRGSMMGVRRTSETDARNDPLAAAKLASAEFEGKKSRRTSRETRSMAGCFGEMRRNQCGVPGSVTSAPLTVTPSARKTMRFG